MSTDDSRRVNDAAEVAQLAPAPPERDLLPGRHHLLKELVMSEIARTRDTQPAHAPRPRRSRRAVWVPVLAAVIAAAIAGAVIVAERSSQRPPVAGPSGSAGAAPAIQLLAAVAAVTESQTVPAVTDSNYTYVDSMQVFVHSSATVGPDGTLQYAPGTSKLGQPQQRQTWIPIADLCQKGLVRQGGRDLDLISRAGTCPDQGSLNNPTYRLLASLPTDPHTLLARIYAETQGHGSNADQEAFVTIGDLLRESVAPPNVTAALYRAAALIPGVTLVSDSVDAIGRHGVAVARDDGTTLNEWIFNSATNRLLGERDVLTHDAPGRGRTGDVVGSTAILSQAVVTNIGQTT